MQSSQAFVRLPFTSLSLLALLSACAAPVAYPRSARIQQQGVVQVGLHSNVNYTPMEVTVAEPGGAGEQRLRSHPDGFDSSSPRQLAALPFIAEPHVRMGLGGDFELGGILSAFRGGVELRAAVLDERAGAPLSLALSGALMVTPVIGREPRTPAARAGLDASAELDGVTPTLGLYLGYGTHHHDDLSSGAFDDSGLRGAEVRRDELRLSVPVGLQLFAGERWDGVTLGVVPEWTLRSAVDAIDCGAACSNIQPGAPQPRVTGFRQSHALFITVGVDLGTRSQRRRMDPWEPPSERP